MCFCVDHLASTKCHLSFIRVPELTGSGALLSISVIIFARVGPWLTGSSITWACQVHETWQWWSKSPTHTRDIQTVKPFVCRACKNPYYCQYTCIYFSVMFILCLLFTLYSPLYTQSPVQYISYHYCHTPTAKWNLISLHPTYFTAGWWMACTVVITTQ